MSRLRFLSTLATLAAILTAAAVLVSCGDDDSSGENPQQVVENATLQGIESGELELSLNVVADGEEGGDIDVELSGPFQGGGKGELPQLDITAKASGTVGGDEIDFDGGLVLLPNSAYVNYEGTEYEVDPTTFSFVESAIEQAQREGAGEGESADATACQEALGEVNVAELVENASNEGSADVGGTSTTQVSGDLDVPGAIDALVGVARSPACSAQVGAAGSLPSEAEIDEAKKEVRSAVKIAHADVYVGEDDIVRRIAAELKIEPEGSGDAPESVDIAFDLQLTGVNEEQEITAPDNAKPLNDLFLKLGVNPIELLGLLQGEGGGEGLGDLLEGIGGGSAGSGGGGGGNSGGANSGGGGANSGGGQQAYLECLQGARTPADLQKCASNLQ